MFLKKMYLKGFKSFAYPVEVSFTNGLTVIVGPNGSGKSNINDALKWVLGEASKKNLRASKASDMIFSGSPDEKPSEYAEVTLFVDNSNKILNSKEKDISITRKSYLNSHENEYFINKELVRRKDVKDLFLDTGLGNTDLSIISQGSISKIIEASPKAMREVLNEAAGVSRYQKQKEEALRNLMGVERNLEILDVKHASLEKQIKPLRKASEKAQQYFKIREKLEKIELPIIQKQLIQSNKNVKVFSEELQIEQEKVTFSNDKLKNNNIIFVRNQKQILKDESTIRKLTQRLEKLKEKIEQQKHSKKSDIDGLKFKIEEIKSSLAILNKNLDSYSEQESLLKRELTQKKDELLKVNNYRNKGFLELQQLESNLKQINRDGEIKVPYGVKKILENKSIFKNLMGTVKDLYKSKPGKEIAVSVGTGSNNNNIVMKDEHNIKDALQFLKQNSYGVATFIPYEQVKPKTISEEFRSILDNIRGYQGTLTENMEFHEKYTRLFQFVGGTTLIFDTFDNGLKAAKIIDYRFKIISLDGDTILPGFLIRGGSNKSKSKYLDNQRQKVEEQIKELRSKLDELKTRKPGLEKFIDETEKEVDTLRYEQVRIQEKITSKENDLSSNLYLYQENTGEEYNQDKNTLNKGDAKNFNSIEEIDLEIKKLISSKEILSKENLALKEVEEGLREEWSTASGKVTDLKISLNKDRNLLQQNILILQKEYKINEEILLEKEFPKLNVSKAEAETRIAKYREEIEEIGAVNVDSIKEFATLDKEFQTLTSELQQLRETKEKLLSTVEEMDKRMIEKFSKTFDNINVEFNASFIKLFSGGTARIKYTDPENILDSGIEIYARSPGKNVKNIQLYSGGEKSMIAIALIFAINKVRSLPLLMLDEVEAALDEANVERFASFAKEINKHTQVIITSHRPGTMEKADVLFGVTMEKQGITKILTVKLEEAVNMTE